MQVAFHSISDVPDALLEYAVIVSRYASKWVMCKHRERCTYEVPGGHREAGEDIVAAARRELWEETGATEYTLEVIYPYSVVGFNGEEDDQPSYGMLCCAEITALSLLPDISEIESVHLFEVLPENLTFPEIQPALMDKAAETLMARDGSSKHRAE